MVRSKLYKSVLRQSKLLKEAQEITQTVNDTQQTQTPQTETQEIELTEEQLSQLLNGGGMSNVPQMLADPCLMSFYSRLENREILINDIVDDYLIEYYQYILDWVSEDNENNIPIESRTPVKLYINTNGGCLNSALFFIDLLSTVKQKIITIGMGKCYSAGSILLLAGQKGNRFVFKNCDILYHDGQYGTQNSTLKTFDEFKHMEKIEKKLKKLVLECTNVSSKKYDKKYRTEWYMDSEQAVKNGFADKIITDISEIL